MDLSQLDFILKTKIMTLGLFWFLITALLVPIYILVCVFLSFNYIYGYYLGTQRAVL